MMALPVSAVERLVQIADRAGVKQGFDLVGPHDTVILEAVRRELVKAKESA